jgi:hypothetical protein
LDKRVEGEGGPPGPVPAIDTPDFAGRVSVFFRGASAFPTPASCSLAQLYERLLAVTDGTKMGRARLQVLTLLVATDLSDARRFPSLGAYAEQAMPMSAWRKRYAGVDLYVE